VIFDASNLKLPLKLKVDLCVVGSGAGGSAAAMAAAEAGLDVLIIEAGPFVPPFVMNQREEHMVPALLEANGAQTSSDRGTAIIQGRALGGSTVHNINLCKRIPAPILREWRETRGLEHLGDDVWNSLYREVEEMLEISEIPASQVSRHNSVFRDGCESLGWHSGLLQHNRSGCIQSGFCAVGCAYDAKNNAVKVIIPRALEASAQIITHCKAVRVRFANGKVTGIEARALDPVTREATGTITIEAPRVCLSGSATGTAALLLRSKIPDPSGETGNGLTIHPALVAAGDFDEPVRAWKGIPQSVECTEFLDFEAAHPGAKADEAALKRSQETGHRTWLIPAFAHPMSTATILPGWGADHRKLMSRYDHMAVFSGMIHDQSQGRVRPKGDLGHTIDWAPNSADQKELLFGLKRSVELLLGAGARRVFVPARPVLEFKPGDDLSAIDVLSLKPGNMQITAVHPMSTVPMGDDPTRSAVNSQGKHHHIRGLWVADGSLFPTSIGVPPQVSIYALGLHVGRAIAQSKEP